MLRRFCLLTLVSLTAGAMSCPAKIDRPAAPITRPGPEMSTTTAVDRDTLFARAVAAVKERGYTEVSPDQPHWQLRAKSPTKIAVVISLIPAGDSTKVTIQASGERKTAGIDNDAMTTVLTLMSDIAPAPARVVAPATPDDR